MHTFLVNVINEQKHADLKNNVKNLYPPKIHFGRIYWNDDYNYCNILSFISFIKLIWIQIILFLPSYKNIIAKV